MIGWRFNFSLFWNLHHADYTYVVVDDDIKIEDRRTHNQEDINRKEVMSPCHRVIVSRVVLCHQSFPREEPLNNFFFPTTTLRWWMRTNTINDRYLWRRNKYFYVRPTSILNIRRSLSRTSTEIHTRYRFIFVIKDSTCSHIYDYWHITQKTLQAE